MKDKITIEEKIKIDTVNYFKKGLLDNTINPNLLNEEHLILKEIKDLILQKRTEWRQ